MEKTINERRSIFIENSKTMLFAHKVVRVDSEELGELWPDGKGGFDIKVINEDLGEHGMYLNSITKEILWL